MVSQLEEQNKKNHPHIGSYTLAPSYTRDNVHITNGYRINFHSPWQILKSMFMIHNESINIWSHLLGAIAVFITIGCFLSFVSSYNPPNESFTKIFQNKINLISEVMSNFTSSMDFTNLQFNQIQATISQTISAAQNSFIQLQNHLENLILNDSFSKIKEFLQKQKLKFETVLIPQIISEMSQTINSTQSTIKIKESILSFKKELDSDAYSYLEVIAPTPNPRKISRWPVIAFLVSAAICLLCSATFHLFLPLSPRIFTILQRMDYAGINILIAGSSYPCIYYTLYCNLSLAIFYMIETTCVASFLFVLALFDWLHKPQNTKIKAILYGGLASLSMLIPIAHIVVNQVVYQGYGDTFSSSNAIPFYALIGVSYLSGLYIYAIKCPQRHYPGKFNICGHSHQFLHICVIFGIIFTYGAAITCFNSRKMAFCPAQIPLN